MSELVFSGHQPNFLPYMGFFYKMFQSDIFVLDDDVQYSRTELQNSNFIKVNGTRVRITVPVHAEGTALIKDVPICYDRGWNTKMLKTFQMAYARAKHFEEAYEMLERHLLAGHEKLADINIALIMELHDRFRLQSKIVISSREVPTELKKNERNIYQCVKLGGSVYYSGVGGKAYNDEAAYKAEGIQIVYSDFRPDPYLQIGKSFLPNLSVADYIFNNGFVAPESWVKWNGR